MKALTDELKRWRKHRKGGRDQGWKAAFRAVFRGVLAGLFGRRTVVAQPCDVLLVHPSEKSYRQGRKKQLVTLLEEAGLRVIEHVERGSSEKLKRREFVFVRSVPWHARWEAFSAQYLLQRYPAKIILTERNGWIVPSYIKKLRTEKSLIVHLAHAVVTAQSSQYDYYDYDYYLVYGQSSYDYLKSLESGFGKTQVCFKGPYFMYADVRLVAQQKNAGAVLFMGSGPDYEDDPEYAEVCQWVIRLAEEKVVGKVYIKNHPRWPDPRWVQAARRLNGALEVLTEEQFPFAMSQSRCALMSYTNALIDVSLSRVPFIMLGAAEDYFSICKFSIPWAKNYTDLKQKLITEVASFDERFLTYHVSNTTRMAASVVDFVVALSQERASQGFTLEGRFGSSDTAMV